MAQQKGAARAGKEAAAQYNYESQSNGSLMRATPMAVYLSRVSNLEKVK
eukprot:CAMPEP_0170499666 /NCGR_PEP_ID=MMETSP0208-20121228/32142_1 /TAXON_ID=197538 /ORGANISM="Strombidium inclinatum, Strain S3" /LENGTH=48 /DNA_ID= /DNA_START= /DNA_END= /DNA_ORIENTATION=